MSKKITLSDDETTATVSSASLLDPLTNILNPNVTFTGIAKYVVPAATAAAGMLVSNKRHSAAYLNFGGANAGL